MWSLWAGKETAYKILVKDRPDLPFIPRACEVHLDEDDKRGPSMDSGSCNPPVEGTVKTPHGVIPIRIYRRCTYIHAIGLSKGENLFDHVLWGIEVLPDQTGVDWPEVESRIARQALKRRVATQMGWNENEMEIRRTESVSRLGPPRLYYQGRRTTMDLSLSHDGRFGACAILMFNPEARPIRSEKHGLLCRPSDAG